MYAKFHVRFYKDQTSLQNDSQMTTYVAVHAKLKRGEPQLPNDFKMTGDLVVHVIGSKTGLSRWHMQTHLLYCLFFIHLSPLTIIIHFSISDHLGW